VNKNKDEEPVTSEYVLNGLKYKIGRHNFVYVWLNDRWVKSTKKIDDLKGKRVSRFRDYGK
jgi:hypothetical protein